MESWAGWVCANARTTSRFTAKDAKHHHQTRAKPPVVKLGKGPRNSLESLQLTVNAPNLPSEPLTSPPPPPTSTSLNCLKYPRCFISLLRVHRPQCSTPQDACAP